MRHQGSSLLTGLISCAVTATLTLVYFLGCTSPATAQQQPTKKSTPDPYFQGSSNGNQSDSDFEKPTPNNNGLAPIKPTTNSWSAPLTPIPVPNSNQVPPKSELDLFGELKLPAPTKASPERVNAADAGLDNVGGGDFAAAPDSQPSAARSSIIRKQTNTLPLPSSDPPKTQDTLAFRAAHPVTSNAQPNAEPELEAFELGKVLALVGGEPIFVGDLMLEVNQMIEKFMPTAPRSVKTREAKKLIPRVLPKHVEAKILFQGIVQGMPAEFQENIGSVIDQAGEEFDNKALPDMMEKAGVKTTGEFDAQLRGQGSSLRKLRRSWSVEQLTRHFVGRKLSSVKPPTHQEMLEQYRANLFTYDIPAKAKWEQVMIQFSKSDSRADAKRKIADMGNRIVNGANFQSIAKKESHGFRADQGGQHDWTTRGALVLNELDEAIFSLPIGELSDIIETAQGFHIVRVLERNEKSRTPFLEAQVEIKEKLIAEKRQAAFEDLMAEFKREIPVEYFDD